MTDSTIYSPSSFELGSAEMARLAALKADLKMRRERCAVIGARVLTGVGNIFDTETGSEENFESLADSHAAEVGQRPITPDAVSSGVWASKFRSTVRKS